MTRHRKTSGRWPATAARALVLGLALATGLALPIPAAAQGLVPVPAQAVHAPQGAPTPHLHRVQSEAPAPQRGAVTNLPLPRYVSLRGSEGNARRGPSLSHRIDWVFRHAGMPLRVTAEFGHWRRVEDRDGAGGWVHYALLSGVRTALVTQDMLELRTRPSENAEVVARAESGAILRLGECNPDWCRVSGGGQRGWVPKGAIWGVDPGETRD